MSQDDVAAPQHPLFAQKIRPILTWNEWLDHWQATTSVQALEGLLHCGFSIPLDRHYPTQREYDEIDRLIFYLAMADGWVEADFLVHPEDGRLKYYLGYENGRQIVKKPSELRQQLARKAFDMLCLNFFRMNLLNEDHELSGRWGVVCSDRLLPHIVNFFRLDRGYQDRYFRMHNLSYHWREAAHNEKLAVTFIENLAQFLWRWKERPSGGFYISAAEKAEIEKINLEKRIRIDQAMPWMIDVLSFMRKLDLLHPYAHQLTEACLAKLKEIALGNELNQHSYPVTKTRLVTSIEEACYAGSAAAWLLKEHELKSAHHARLTRIYEAEITIQDAERDLRKLTGPVTSVDQI